MKNPQYNGLKVIVLLVIIVIAGYFILKNITDTKLNQAGSVVEGTPTTTTDAPVVHNPTWHDAWHFWGGGNCVYLTSQGGFSGTYNSLGVCVPTEWFTIVTPPAGDGTVPKDRISTPVKDVTVSIVNGYLSIAGKQISATQAQLFALGYLSTATSGVLDTNTVNALRTYQTEGRLQVTGTITPETTAALDTMIAQIPVIVEKK